jgi:EAL domain-containing protein (putative c-di-GMP-specific phosphodiesterase class I)
MMPGMDGVQFIQKLGDLKHKPALAIMSSTSRRTMISSSLVAKSVGLTVIGLISKPVGYIDLRRLYDKLKTLELAKIPASSSALDHDPLSLQRALEQGEIVPWFQPKKDLSTGRIVAAEALARWQHPTLGLLFPKDFLPAIVSSNLEEQLLLQFVVHTIKAQSAWARHGYEIPVSVNLPTHLLDMDDLPDRLQDLVLSHHGKPSAIGFELMECSTTEDNSHYFAGACRLRFKGFGLAQDDFGQGYSSYFNLVSTPFTELKIDRSLVSGCVENESIASALASIVALGQKLGLNVVAEGVETQEELALLRRIKCDQVQGFLISKAVSQEQFTSLLIQDGPASS